MQGLLTPAEAQHMIVSLKPFSISDVGTSAWLQQHSTLDSLNMQAHYDAQIHSEEYVKEGLVLRDKISLLVVDLIITELWHEKVFPLIDGHITGSVDAGTAYMLMYHEVTVANLLELVLHHEDAAEALTEEAAIELCDWCHRKLADALDGKNTKQGRNSICCTKRSSFFSDKI